MKKHIVALLGIFIIANIVYADESQQPLKLTIRSDKEIYTIGDGIKILFTVENKSDKTFDLDYNPNNYFDYEIYVLGNRKYERFPDQGMKQGWITSKEHQKLLPKQKWSGEAKIANIGKDKIYKYKGHPAMRYDKKLYYNGVFIADSTFRYKGALLVPEGSGKYSITFKICDETLKNIMNPPQKCLESNTVEMEIKE